MALPAGLVVISREGCGLCDEMLHELAAHERAQALPPVTVVDVDSDPSSPANTASKCRCCCSMAALFAITR